METTTTTARTARGTGRFRRADALPASGRLHQPPGASERGIRCECGDCGAHLIAVPAEGALHGICLVCGADEPRPV